MKLALDDGTSPTSHAVTRMDSRSRYFTSRHFPIADHRVYPLPSSLPSRFFSSTIEKKRDGLTSFPSESTRVERYFDFSPLFVRRISFRVTLTPCMTIGCNLICNCEFSSFEPLKNPSKFYRCFQTMSPSIVQIFKITRFFQVSIKNR